MTDAKQGDAEVVITPLGAGEEIALGPIQLTILEDGSSTDHRLGLALIRIPPRTSGPPPHWHARHDEGFYVIAGTAHFLTANGEQAAPAGTLAVVPPGAVHTFANHGDDECVILNTFTPDLYVQYFRDLEQLQPGPDGLLQPPQILELMARYGTEPYPGVAGAPMLRPNSTPR